jgi:hypothetical protein
MSRASIASVFVARTPLLDRTPLVHACSGQSALAYEQLEKQQEALDALGKSIAEQLFVLVPTLADPRSRASILRVRREVFNGSIPFRRVSEIQVQLNGSGLEPVISTFRSAMARRDELALRADLTYRQERQATVDELVSLVRENEDFANALSLSSPSLFDTVAKYAASLQSDSTRTAKLRNVERTLLQYGVRASTKCTPFSRFAVVMVGRVVRKGQSAGEIALSSTGRIGVDRTKAQVNLEILNSLSTRLSRIERLPQSLEVRLDELIASQLGQDEFKFLVTKGKREFVSKVKSSEPLAKLVDILVSEPNVRIDTLLQRMHELTRGYQSRERHRRTVAALVRSGVVVPAIVDDYSVDTWVDNLGRLLKGLRGPVARSARRELLSALNAVRAVSDGFPGARNRSLRRAHSVLSESRTNDQVSAKTVSTQARTPVFEDAASDSELRLCLGSNSETVANELEVLCDVAHRLGWPRGEQATMRRYFDKTFAGHKEVPLLSFYVSYYRDHMLEHLRREENHRRGRSLDDGSPHSLTNPLGVPLVDSLSAAHGRLRAALRSLAADGHPEVCLSLDALREVAEAVPRCQSDEYSFALFCHLTEGDVRRLLIPGGKVAVGFGKYYSRFCGILDPSLRAQILESATHFGGDISEVFHCQQFNANIHEALTPTVIAYPNSPRPSGWPTIHVRDLMVQASGASDDELELRSRVTGELVRPVDLGFISPRQRPPLLQLLTRFGPQRGFTIGYPQPGEYIPLGESGRLGFPRLNFGRSLTLSRRQWRFSCKGIPVPPAGSFDRIAHQAVVRWSRSCGVPDGFYATFHSGVSGEIHQNRVEKAQFFQLSDPLMSEYFVRLASQSSFGCVVVEEAVPSVASNRGSTSLRPFELVLHFEKKSGIVARTG